MYKYGLLFVLLFVSSLWGCQCGLTCPSGFVKCEDKCIDIQSDVNNCGQCGNACRLFGARCLEGSCQACTGSGVSICNGLCTRLLDDPNNCGACRRSCGGRRCVKGVCEGETPCPGAICNGVCTKTSVDPSHCGGCNKACPKGGQCVSGNCLCPMGMSRCEGACVDTKNNPNHCGACGNVCVDGAFCDNGRCRPTKECKAPQEVCFGACVDTQRDKQNCGKCGVICPALKHACVQGKCTCPAGTAFCSDTGRCVDLQRDPNHCGACNNLCPKGRGCNKGRCSTICTTGQILCNTRCVNPSSDLQHCGACGNVCAKGQLCQNGRCLCPPGTTTCQGLCVDTQTSSRHCGACGNTCQPDETCKAGQCTESRCTKDTDCPAKCDFVTGQCVDCLIDAHCGTSALCLSQVCSAAPKNCQSDKDCPTNQVCDTTGRCALQKKQQVQKKVGDPCTPGQSTLTCDPTLSLRCDPKTSKCVLTDAKEGEACGKGSPNNLSCEAGLLCLQFDQSGSLSRCHKECDPNKVGECSYNKELRCEALLNNGKGLCYDTQCQTDADCAFAGYTCRQTGGGNICFPEVPAGPVSFGGICKDPSGSFGCNTDPKKGGDPQWFCLRAQNPTGQGYCSRDCSLDSKCPAWTSADGKTKLASQCVQISQSGNKACLFPCGQMGQTCPKGLTCQNVGQQLCLAP